MKIRCSDYITKEHKVKLEAVSIIYKAKVLRGEVCLSLSDWMNEAFGLRCDKELVAAPKDLYAYFGKLFSFSTLLFKQM